MLTVSQMVGRHEAPGPEPGGFGLRRRREVHPDVVVTDGTEPIRINLTYAEGYHGRGNHYGGKDRLDEAAMGPSRTNPEMAFCAGRLAVGLDLRRIALDESADPGADMPHGVVRQPFVRYDAVRLVAWSRCSGSSAGPRTRYGRMTCCLPFSRSSGKGRHANASLTSS
jgi:hypothetical protein